MNFIDNLTRKKHVSFDSSPLSRSLTLIDLTLLGIGSTIGVGFYILAGQVARDTAGPAVTISFLIAAVASVFAGLCYAEFGARVPKAGSAYIYSYVCVGEFIAFIIGWNLLLEYIIGTASVARGFSSYFDDLINHKMSAAFNRTMHMDVNTLGEYPDFFAFGVVLLLSGILMLGVKESSRLNNIFTGLNVFVIVYVIIAGSTLADKKNWHLSEAAVHNETVCEDQSHDWGTGGFSPFGFSGIIHGAATCFFGFIGFDVIATTGEEAIRPERNLPLAISISLLCIFVAYFGMSTILTLAVPYCMEDPDAPLIELFNGVDMDVSKWIVSIGAIFGFSASLIGAMFPMPRIVYAMADDGLIFRPLSKVNKRFKTPVIATICTGILAGIMALLFTLDTLVDMMSIGTLMAYTIVAVCVMLLRYTDETSINSLSSEYVLLKYAPDNENEAVNFSKTAEGKLEMKSNAIRYSWKDYGKQMLNSSGLKEPSDLSSSLVNYATVSFAFFCFLLDLFLTLFGTELTNGDAGIITLICIFFVLTFCNLVVIARQPASRKKLTFQVPFVPWIPALSTFINLYLMCNLSGATWIRFAVWMAIGFLVYFLYGIRKSTANDIPQSKLTGEKNDGFELEDINKNIPPIIILPPTPWASKQGTPTSSIKPELQNKKPIVQSVFVASEINALNPTAEKVEKNESASQSIDISPLKLESIKDLSSDSESEEESNGNNLESTKIVIAATVYNSNEFEKKEDYVQNNSPLYLTNEDNMLDSDMDEIKSPVLIVENNVTDSDDSHKMLSNPPNNIDNNHNQTEITDSSEIFKIEEKIVKDDSVKNYEKSLSEGNNNSSDTKTCSKTPVNAATSCPIPILEKNKENIEFNNFDSTHTFNSAPNSAIVKRRHPHKILVKASSFDNIPPSKLDNPYAKKVKNFVIIPVNEPGKEEIRASSSSLGDGQKAPLPSVASTPTSPNDYLDKKYHPLMVSDLKSRLKQLEEPHKDIEVSYEDFGDSKKSTSNLLTSPPLNIIRERGESKISQTDIRAINENVRNGSLIRTLEN